MEVLIFRTDISGSNGLNLLKSLFNRMWQVKDWSVDLEDSDRVLRIESVHLSVDRVEDMVCDLGISCHELGD